MLHLSFTSSGKLNSSGSFSCTSLVKDWAGQHQSSYALDRSHLQAVVGQIQEAHDEDGLTQLGQSLLLGARILQPLEINDGNGRERHGTW